MVSLLAWNGVDCGFMPWSCETKYYQIGMCCFSAAKHATLRRKSKDWLAQNQDNLADLSDMLPHALLLQ